MLAGLVKRTTGVSVIGSAKRKNSPALGSGLDFFDGVVVLSAASAAGTIASIARRVIAVLTTQKDADRKWAVALKPQVAAHRLRAVKNLRFRQVFIRIYRSASQADFIVHVRPRSASGSAR